MTELREDCRAFRLQLELALEGRARPEELAPLGWHEHLLGCEGCRDLLAREEALEELLAALPEPRLSIERRVALLARLRGSKEGDSELDHLLESDQTIEAPAGLTQRVLVGIQDARLDAALDLDRDLEIPTGLAARVLDSLDAARTPAPSSGFVLDRRWAWPAAAAAAAVLFFSLQGEEAPVTPDFVEGPSPVVPDDQPSEANAVDDVDVAAENSLPAAEEDDLLAVLDLLEDDVLWTDESHDLELAAGIDITSEWLLEYTLYESIADDADTPEGQDG
jgi:hypothetical protein